MKTIKIFKNSLPIAFAYIVLGFTYGVLLATKGGSPWEAFFISALGYSGATQFVALEFYRPDYPYLLMIVTLAIINLRHIIYGLSFLNTFKGPWKFYLFSTLTDETFALSRIYKDKNPRMIDWVKIHFLNQSYWIVGCVSGSLIPSSFIHHFAGADFALSALFIAILASTMRKGEKS